MTSMSSLCTCRIRIMALLLIVSHWMNDNNAMLLIIIIIIIIIQHLYSAIVSYAGCRGVLT